MTFWYKFFGLRPGDGPEFIDYMRRKSIVSLNITLDEINLDFDRENGEIIFYECFPVLQAGGKKLSLENNSIRCTPFNTYEGNLEILAKQKEGFDRVLQMARDYQQKGLGVTVVGKSIEIAEEKFRECQLKKREDPSYRFSKGPATC